MTAKDLKNALLQEAVQGRLVPQIASEGNARDLLEEIRKEKLSHGLDFANAKSGKRKSKKETALAGSNPCDITEEEIPFDIPESWCWCRLGEIVKKLTDGTHRTPKYVEKGIPFLSVKNLSSGKMDFENTKFITPEEHKELYARCNPEKGDMLLTKVGTTGIPVINDSDIEFSLFVSVALLKFSHEYIDEKYFLYLLQSPLVQEQAQENTKGVGNKNWVMDAIAKTVLVLPPLAEQKRIVVAIEKFMPLIEEYGKKETQLKAINEKIGTLTKKAILQEAVQGKLVPQIAAEGNAKDLLEEIRKEKLSHGLDFANAKSGKRKSKKETALAGSNPCDITEEEIPFDIPENWCWCRLGEIVDFGKCENAEPDEINADDWILDLEDIEKDSGRILAFKTKKGVESKSTKHIFKEGYVLYSKLRPYLNKCVVAPKNGFCTSEILPLDFGKLVYNRYAQLYLMSPFFVDYTTSLSFGVKMPRLGTEDGKKALFPLPPLAEQKRIVAAIEKMLPLCEKLGE